MVAFSVCNVPFEGASAFADGFVAELIQLSSEQVEAAAR